jgi:hypothetical protein
LAASPGRGRMVGDGTGGARVRAREPGRRHADGAYGGRMAACGTGTGGRKAGRTAVRWSAGRQAESGPAAACRVALGRSG